MGVVRLPIGELLGSDRLVGRVPGQRDFGRICEALAGTPSGQIVLLDFGGITLVSGSWANSANRRSLNGQRFDVSTYIPCY